MSEFRGLEELSAGSMGSFAQSRKTSWASQGKYLPRSLPSVHLCAPFSVFALHEVFSRDGTLMMSETFAHARKHN